MRIGLLISTAAICLAACGGAGGANDGSSASARPSDCPPEQKGSGVMVNMRYNYEDLLAANKWREDMFPSACAGTLANLVPDLPEGYGVMPTTKPHVMSSDQVYVAYAEMPEPLYSEPDNPNMPRDMDIIEYEIVRFSDDEMTQLRSWMTANPDNFLAGSVQGKEVYLLGGFGSGRPGKGDRIATSLHAFLDDNIVVRIRHKSLFTQQAGLHMAPLVESLLGDILAGEGKT